MGMKKYNLYMSERIAGVLENLKTETKGEFVRKAIHFYLDYHEQLNLIISKLEKLEARIANGIPANQPMFEVNEEDEESIEESINDILGMGGDDDEEF